MKKQKAFHQTTCGLHAAALILAATIAMIPTRSQAFWSKIGGLVAGKTAQESLEAAAKRRLAKEAEEAASRSILLNSEAHVGRAESSRVATDEAIERSVAGSRKQPSNGPATTGQPATNAQTLSAPANTQTAREGLAQTAIKQATNPGTILSAGAAVAAYHAVDQITDPLRAISDALTNNPDLIKRACDTLAESFIDVVHTTGTLVALLVAGTLVWFIGFPVIRAAYGALKRWLSGGNSQQSIGTQGAPASYSTNPKHRP
jgi:hypothetical protein